MKIFLSVLAILGVTVAVTPAYAQDGGGAGKPDFGNGPPAGMGTPAGDRIDAPGKSEDSNGKSGTPGNQGNDELNGNAGT
ncbi:hypothetical protein [Aestuariicoccus sp. MJ-SS9]|uniref:hypothetical protein n=1 Tax=Aestuariicoccus sp. MJ-SS9 TaxID=3079855 RepID=UPI0029108619|nr:hypothetical protein [Aestuariicoccus sp. MJ-SS9]MDU8914073.1 hypothetical protein [Aestuariicoccus sp. MJ-SS9]